MKNRLLPMLAGLCIFVIGSAHAETRVTYKSAKSTSSYYQMAVQIAETVKQGSDGAIIVTVEESQGSVQNVKEAAKRQGNYVFTTPPSLIDKALSGDEPFDGDDNAAYQRIRSLFIIPSLTMHFVVREDSGIKNFADLESKDFIIGKGSFGARKAASTFSAFGLEGKINLVDVELNAAVPALKNRKVHGFATAGSYPAPNVMEAAASTPIRLLDMHDDQISLAGGTKMIIPGGTYPGVDYDVTTISLPVGAYTTTAMDENTAYILTKTFWENKDAMAEINPWWGGVSAAMLSDLAAKLHPGALKYYREADIVVAQELQ